MFTPVCGVQFGSFGGGLSGGIYLLPYQNGTPSIPGHMAITDADNNFVLSRAFPISGSYESPWPASTCRLCRPRTFPGASVKSLFQ